MNDKSYCTSRKTILNEFDPKKTDLDLVKYLYNNNLLIYYFIY